MKKSQIHYENGKSYKKLKIRALRVVKDFQKGNWK